jgi:hypothetical protein
MHIPVIVGMYCSGKQSVTETASDAGVMQALKALAAVTKERD